MTLARRFRSCLRCCTPQQSLPVKQQQQESLGVGVATTL